VVFDVILLFGKSAASHLLALPQFVCAASSSWPKVGTVYGMEAYVNTDIVDSEFVVSNFEASVLGVIIP
jgi:hypothetical protein